MWVRQFRFLARGSARTSAPPILARRLCRSARSSACARVARRILFGAMREVQCSTTLKAGGSRQIDVACKRWLVIYALLSSSICGPTTHSSRRRCAASKIAAILSVRICYNAFATYRGGAADGQSVRRPWQRACHSCFDVNGANHVSWRRVVPDPSCRSPLCRCGTKARCAEGSLWAA